MTKLGTRLFNTYVKKRIDPRGKPYYWINGDVVYMPEPHSDVTALRNNKVSLTPLTLDNTAFAACGDLKRMLADQGF